MEELVAWLRGVLDDIETAAKAVRRLAWESDGRITVSGDVAGVWVLGDDGDPVAIAQHATAEDGEGVDPRVIATHIVLHDPEQVLADIEAKRKILDAYTTRADLASRGGLVHRDPLAFAVRTLASAYRHRPGWQDSWGA